ncbi:MAG: magnesium transporter [Ignavibacteria bacterium]|nr:magnesium transporter [Ignavibacteria bacterium]
MLKELLKPEILELIELRQWTDLREVLTSWEPPEIADLMLDVEQADRVLLFRSLPRDISAEVFAYLESDKQDDLLHELTNQETREILSQLPPDDRTALLEELPAEATQKLLTLLSPEDLKEARLLLGYPEQSIGRLTTPHFVSVRADWTIKQALAHIRTYDKNNETINRIYVTDNDGRLLDDITLRAFIFSDPKESIRSLMDENVISVSAFDDQEVAVRTMEKYDIPALPVVDSNGVLIGIVTFDDVMDISEEEATEDFQKFGGMEALDKPYNTISFLGMVKKRAGWLVILFIGEMFTATALSYFEGALEKAIILSMFLPLIMSSGGNSGSQAATLMVRAISLGEVTLKDWWWVMRREFLSGLFLGLILGAIGFVRIVAWSAMTHAYGDHYLPIAFTVSFSLVGVVLWGSLSGSMLPFLLKKLNFDPAASSAPFVATLVDVTGIIIYFSFAVWLLKGTLL